MELKRLPYELTVCKLKEISDFDLNAGFYFIGKTDEELSLVCRTEDTPGETLERSDGWRGLRIQGVLDFSLIGILSKLSGILAENRIGIFAVSKESEPCGDGPAERVDRLDGAHVTAGGVRQSVGQSLTAVRKWHQSAFRVRIGG